jgi:uncharacterized protein with PIN domain
VLRAATKRRDILTIDLVITTHNKLLNNKTNRMNKLKFLFLITMAVFTFSAVDAQTKKMSVKTATTTKTTTTKASEQAAKYQCPMKCEGDKTYAKAGKCPTCKMALAKVQKEVAAYKCPMMCEGDKTYTKADKCPVCKMNLVKADTKNVSGGHGDHNHN